MPCLQLIESQGLNFNEGQATKLLHLFFQNIIITPLGFWGFGVLGF